MPEPHASRGRYVAPATPPGAAGAPHLAQRAGRAARLLAEGCDGSAPLPELVSWPLRQFGHH